jgi:hypothetical protein
MGVVVIALFLLPRSARGHTPGLCIADFEVHPDGHVDARLTFASAEQLGGIALDRDGDGDGEVTPEDVAAAREDLRAFLLDGVGVDADGSPCRATFLDASLTEVDGLLLRASYACASDPAVIEVTLYYLNAEPPGATPPPQARGRRGIARIRLGAATTEGILTGDHRAIALAPTRRAEHRRPSNRARIAALAAATLIVAMLGYGARRLLWARASR